MAVVEVAEQDRLRTTAEAMERLSVSRNTLYAMVASGRLRGVRVGPSAWALRIPESELVRFINSASVPGRAAAEGQGPDVDAG